MPIYSSCQQEARVDYQDMAVMTTAWRRPYYFRDTLESWAGNDGIRDLRRFAISTGPTDRYAQQLEVIGDLRPRFYCGLDILPQTQQAFRENGPHRAIAEAADQIFTGDPRVQFLVFGEEDVLVSSDTLAYMRWAATKFAGDPRVLAVLAHNRHGQGWDLQTPARDHDADQETVRLIRYFNPWCFGVWRDRWETILSPEWDRTCDSGGPMNSGYDWNVQQRILPGHKMVCVVPDASRSQNIGEREGWASTPDGIRQAHSYSFRAGRENCDYRLVGA
jgi:hypothetical protein